MNRCLYCYKEHNEDGDYHKKCATKFFGTSIVPTMPYALDEMNELAQQVIERSISLTGVQPKLSMSVLDSTRDKRLTVVGALGGNYIFKPPNADFEEMPENEHLTMLLATLYGISTVPSTLIRLKSGELSYITKRIDRREDGSKIHMLDMFQITEAYDKYRSSHERVAKAIRECVANTGFDILRFFELVVFSYLVGNNDMHLKNFSLLNDQNSWSLSPAYDLLNVHLVMPEDEEELALTLGGKKRKISRKHFVDFGLSSGLTEKQIQGVFTRFPKRKKATFQMIEISFLNDEMKRKYIELLDSRYMKLDLM